MVKLIQTHECWHETCNGGTPAGVDENDSQLYGGTWCVCWCHEEKRKKCQCTTTVDNPKDLMGVCSACGYPRQKPTEAEIIKALEKENEGLKNKIFDLYDKIDALEDWIEGMERD